MWNVQSDTNDVRFAQIASNTEIPAHSVMLFPGHKLWDKKSNKDC
jgi:hypothetical protein